MAKRKTTTSSVVKERWKAAHYERLTVYLDKDVAAAYKAQCDARGLSYSDIPKAAILEFLGDDSSQ